MTALAKAGMTSGASDTAIRVRHRVSPTVTSFKVYFLDKGSQRVSNEAEIFWRLPDHDCLTNELAR